MPGGGRSPRHSASVDASRSIGQLTCMIENTRHVVHKLVTGKQAQGRKAQQGCEAEAPEMRQHM
eukprot:12910676-Prorocentrum_lima.AAC.1